MSVLTCVTVQKSCRQLIDYGAQLSKEKGEPLLILHVAGITGSFLGNPEEGEALEFLYEISSRHNAEMTVRRASDVVGEIASFVKAESVSTIVMGQSRSAGKDLPGALRVLLPGVDVRVLYPQAV